MTEWRAERFMISSAFAEWLRAEGYNSAQLRQRPDGSLFFECERLPTLDEPHAPPVADGIGCQRCGFVVPHEIFVPHLRGHLRWEAFERGSNRKVKP